MMLVLSRRLTPGLLALALLLLAPSRGQAQLMTFPEWYTLANAAANNRPDEVAFILRRGDNPNFIDSTGRTPLGYAAANGNVASKRWRLMSRPAGADRSHRAIHRRSC